MNRLTKEDLKGLVGKERIDTEWEIIMQESIDNALNRIAVKQALKETKEQSEKEYEELLEEQRDELNCELEGQYEDAIAECELEEECCNLNRERG